MTPPAGRRHALMFGSGHGDDIRKAKEVIAGIIASDARILLENVKLAFDSNGIRIPFPQRDVHLYEVKSA